MMDVQLPESMQLGSAIERTAAENREKRKEVGQDDFLTMLVAQLENQDPLNPQDGTEFTAQLATFSSLEQQVAIRESLQKLVEAQSKPDAIEDQLRSAGLIGKDVVAFGEQLELRNSADGQPLPVSVNFELRGDATSAQVRIRDEHGLVVANLIDDDGGLVRGLNRIEWDGRDAYGRSVPPGVYSFEVGAQRGGQAVEVEPIMVGRVTAAAFGEDEPVLRLGDRVVRLDDVFEIRESTW
jgi:flagellar basal-body rod modification protein FlgD